ncbi:hypothetical protein FF100_13435 [Methylobacterium terricola]|uniref:Uncharacterized protein n=1 Tax=Methylobacterium terricola TaxID=2583531 RepID=A0A5C4LIJ1_9HYPH|nr:hypothetical protein [Methylobacterium terricola]TNC12676.1 hypothetical protein FF100_13435 [Methylobacterium terricola]
MAADLLTMLDEISTSLSRTKKGVAGVAGDATPAANTSPHLSLERKTLLDQCATLATPCHTGKSAGGDKRHTSEGVAEGVGRVLQRVAASPIEAADWLAAFDERAAILEFDGRHDRAEAERLALAETVAMHGPQPKAL